MKNNRLLLVLCCLFIVALQLQEAPVTFYLNSERQIVAYQYQGLSQEDADEPYLVIHNVPGIYTQVEFCEQEDSVFPDNFLPQELADRLFSIGYIYKPTQDYNCTGYKVSISNTVDTEFLKSIHQLSSYSYGFPFTKDLLDTLALRPTDEYQVKIYSTEDGSIRYNVHCFRFAFPKTPTSSVDIYKYNTKNYNATLLQGDGNFWRNVTGRGLHQQLNYFIAVPPNLDIHSQCIIQIEQILPESMYIDADQFSTSRLRHYEVINIEKPSFNSKQYYYNLTWPLYDSTYLKEGVYKFSYPLHFRYQKPVNKEYVSIRLNELCRISVKCPEGKYSFREVKSEEQAAAKIPVGNKEHLRMVNFFTLVLTICCALFINKSLRGSPF